MLLGLVVERTAVDNAVDLAGSFLDLAELDAVAEVLDLPVLSAVEKQGTVGSKAAEVAGLVDQLAVVGVERILDKGLLGVVGMGPLTQISPVSPSGTGLSSSVSSMTR